MIKTDIYYSFDDDATIQVGIESEKKIFKTMIEGMHMVETNNICIVISRGECIELSEYFARLSKELNKLKELG